LRRSYLRPAFYLLGRQPITIMGVTTDTAITATTIGITTATIIIVTGPGLPLSTVAPATTATIETSPLFEISPVLVRFDHVSSFIVNADHCIVRTDADFSHD
jgi:hypothetical protein